MEYIIVGDTEQFEDCLVCTCSNKEHAEKVLNEFLNNPTEEDKRLIAGHFNLRIEELDDSEGWWNDPFLAN